MKMKTLHSTVKLPWVAVIAVTVAILYFVGARVFHLWPWLKSTPRITSTAQTTSKVPSAQSTFTGGSPKSPGTSNSANDGSNSVTDNKGNVGSTPSSSQWSKSADGSSIVVYAPTANSLLTSGNILSGTATGSRVFFRLVDNVSGVIAEGNLTVVNGKFSGTFNFSTKATTGQVDIFNQASNGTESNNVKIPVKFNQ